MSHFAIEAPGEANPLTEGNLLNTLCFAASSNQIQVKTATEQLDRWEVYANYHVYLQRAYMDQNTPLQIRHLAIIHLKNSISKYWRSRANLTNHITYNDKAEIRSRFLPSMLYEPDDRLALQNALIIAKIVRYDFPHDWPTAIGTFVDAIRSPDDESHAARALLALLHIYKELSSGCLPRTKVPTLKSTHQIFDAVRPVYQGGVDVWQIYPSEPPMQQTLLAIKLLRRVLVFGYNNLDESHVIDFWRISIENKLSFIRLSAHGLRPSVNNLLGRHVLQLAKLHLVMANTHPAAFALLPGTTELMQSYWEIVKAFGDSYRSVEALSSALSGVTIGAGGVKPFLDKVGTDGDAVEDKSITEKIALKGLLLLRACVGIALKQHGSSYDSKSRSKGHGAEAATFIQRTILTEPFVMNVVDVIISKLFIFRASDLTEWLDEPDEWEKREEAENEDWEFSIRSCSEKLFVDLAVNYKDIVVQPLLVAFYNAASLQNEDAFAKDSIYTAVGLAAPVLHTHLDFDAFVRDVLSHEVLKKQLVFKVLRRRAAILLGQWITVKIHQDTRPLVYQIFMHLLDGSDPLNGQVVRVTAGRQLVKVVADWDSQPEHLKPCAEPILTRLMQLIRDVEVPETKMALLNTVSVIVEHLGQNINPFADSIVNLLPELWEQSGEENLMKQAILTILARLINAMKSDSLPLHPQVFPIIKNAVDIRSDTHVFLLEDALDLLHAVVIQTPANAASTELLELLPQILPILELGTDALRQTLEIIQSYVFLAPAYVLSNAVRSSLLSALSNLFGALKSSESSGLLWILLEHIIRAASTIGGEAGATQVASELTQIKLIPKLLEALHSSSVARTSTGPHRPRALVAGHAKTDYYVLLARLSMGSLNAFCPDATMEWLVDDWLLHLEDVSDPAQKKLMCLALTKYLRKNAPWILGQLQWLMSMWTSVLTELREDEADVMGDSLVKVRQDLVVGAQLESPEDARARELVYADEVHSVNVVLWVREHLGGVIEMEGGMDAFHERWVVNVDRDVLEAFGKLGVL